jgi:hypothetical protein
MIRVDVSMSSNRKNVYKMYTIPVKYILGGIGDNQCGRLRFDCFVFKNTRESYEEVAYS